MTISEKTRKILWARSGNRCAYCKCLLVSDGSVDDSEAIVGDECHIVAASENGPRGISDINPDARDGYENLILLCKTHHKMIDDQTETYTVPILSKLKADHEKWVRDKLEPREVTGKSIQYINLPLVVDAKEIVHIVANADSQHTDYVTPENEHDLLVMQDYLGEFEGLSVLSDEPDYMVKATFRIKNLLQELETCGYFVYGRLIKGTLSLKNGEKTRWKHGFVVIKDFKIPEITVGYDPNFRF